jgi:DNA (cytosine-5)-methyltransferase 1
MRPRALDLFCKAGGAGVGYDRAGFDVLGVDIEPQPNYPFAFVQADALDVLRHWRLDAFALIHASPPCHDWSTVSGRNRKAVGPKGTAWLLEATLRELAPRRAPWVVENVETARFALPGYRLKLCGSSFDLDVRRHRWFASNVLIMQPQCQHYRQPPRFRSLDSRRAQLASVVGVHGHTNYAGELKLRRAAMGIEWMTSAELNQAIPPAYTEFIGRAIMDYYLDGEPSP